MVDRLSPGAERMSHGVSHGFRPKFAGKKAEYLQKLEVLFKAMDEAASFACCSEMWPGGGRHDLRGEALNDLCESQGLGF